LSIFKTVYNEGNKDLYVLCEAYYDPWKIDLPCDENRGVPSAVPSVSLIPTSSSAPTFYDCSCGVGEFKLELELKTNFYPEETSWKVKDENGEILVSESGYGGQKDWLKIFNYEYCLPVGCHDFVIDDSRGDGICCWSGSYDDDFDGYYKASLYGRKEVFNGGDFENQAIENFCGEDVCPFATHYPSTSPSASSPPSISSSSTPSRTPSISPSLVPSTSPSVSSIPTSSSAPTTFPDCSCGVGEFKFELELRTDEWPTDTSWKIEDGNGEILHSESEYHWRDEKFKIFNYEYCLPVGCHDFVIDDSNNDGICCGWTGDGYYKASLYGRKEVFNGGEFRSQAIEQFCGEDLCHIDASKSQFVSFSSLEQKNSPTSAPTTASLNIETLTSTVLIFLESIVTFFKNLLPF